MTKVTITEEQPWISREIFQQMVRIAVVSREMNRILIGRSKMSIGGQVKN